MVDRRNLAVYVALLLYLILSGPAFGQRTELLSSFSERLALLNLRSSLGIRSKDWPIKAEPCLIWNGIRCENGSVAGINICGFKRTRYGKQNPQLAIDSLANLTGLSHFNASGFMLPGSIPDWFGLRLMTLQVLDLSSCSITGVIPLTLGNLTGLQSLNLSDNKLTGAIPPSLGNLRNLSELDLSKNSLTGSIPATFSSLGSLSSLDISSNYLTGPIPPGIGTLLKLQRLDLSDNSFSSSFPSQFGNLTNLVDLDLSSNSLSGSLPGHLKSLGNLQRFLIADNLLSGSLPEDMFGSPSRLQVIVMRHNSFTGILPEMLWSLPQLRVLDISSNNFTGVLPNSTVEFNQGELNISHNMFYGNLSPILGGFRVTDLSDNYFEGKISEYVPANNDSLANNCLQHLSKQRSLAECSTFYTQRGLIFDDFGNPNSSGTTGGKSSELSHKTIIKLVAVAGGLGLALIFLVLLLALCICRKRRTTQGGNGVGPSPAEESPQPHGGAPAVDFSRLGDKLTHQQLLQATNEFNDTNLIKHGHSGDIFNGAYENGIHVVIKRIILREDKNEGHLSEPELFSRVSHQRLVPVLGHCLECDNEKYLVYKFMRNGDLASSFYRKSDGGGDGLQSLDWITRLKIALGAAEGLAYLHHECSPPIVHRDVQASSILLDDKFEVRLGSLSEAGVQDSDAQQSRITRFLRFSQSSEQGPSGSSTTGTCAYDVYCFGKVLLELVTGKLGISRPENPETKEFIEETLQYISSSEKELVMKILDPSLIVDEGLLEEVWAMAIIAKSCLNPKPSRRPFMRHIFNALENPLKVVRDDHSGLGSSSSSRLRRNASRGSGIFGSWRHSLSDGTGGGGGGGKGEAGTSGLRKLGSEGSGGGQNNGNSSSSRRRQSKEIVPERSSFLDESV